MTEFERGAEAMREAVASMVESCDGFSVTSSTPGPNASPEKLATYACRWLADSLAKQIRELPLKELVK